MKRFFFIFLWFYLFAVTVPAQETQVEENDLIQEIINKLTAEKEQTYRLLFISLSGCLMLSAALGVWITRHRKILARNLALNRQIAELTQIEIKEEPLLPSAPEEEPSSSMQLFKKLSEHIQTDKTFTDPGLNRKRLANLLHTNEIYLAKAIREATGKTFSAYLSGIRLQYARQLLDKQPKMTIENIATDSGHGSYTSFYRTFTDEYGITPSEYRKTSALKKAN